MGHDKLKAAVRRRMTETGESYTAARREVLGELRGARRTGPAGEPGDPAQVAGYAPQGHVFISYVREDSAKADWLQGIFEAAGIPVWRDRTSLWPGDDWRHEIRHAITADALVFIACFSSNSAARPRSYMYEELSLAIEELRQRRPQDPWLIPVLFDDCEVPYYELGHGRTLSSIQWASLFGAGRDQEAERLVEAVQRLLGRLAPRPPQSLAAMEAEPPSGSRQREQRAAEPGPPRDRNESVAQDFVGGMTGNLAGHVLRNADAPWNKFSPGEYWRRNHHEVQREDQEIIRLVSRFFIQAHTDRPRAERAIDVGSGTNLYPALLMLPWAEQILLTDFSASNVDWLGHQVADEDNSWTWRPFWHELEGKEGYNQIGEPRKHLREACVNDQGYARIEQRSVFGLPPAQWDLGTMFFVAESITQDPEEFGAAIASFVGALRPGAPFAATFMAGSDGYPVAGTRFPALPITREDVRLHFTERGTTDLSVEMLRTTHRVRDGYQGMIVATGFARGR
jgi:hypothetical protein